MKTLGILFIALGLFLCITIIFMVPGFTMIAVGALLVIAGAVSRRSRDASL
jgi:hypothetical protein